MVLVRGGTLETATDLAGVSSFCLDRTEVTADAYAGCAAAGACGTEGLDCGNAATFGKKGLGAHPVNCVTWHEADAFCREHGKRLPTETEWEWAARGGRRGTTFPWGEEEPAGRACWDGEGNAAGKGERKGTCPVGAHPRSRGLAGLEDLAGNVREWTATPEERFRVLRGGSWGDSLPEFLSASFRGWNAPDERMEHLGFRCAADVGAVARKPKRAPVEKPRAVTDDVGVIVFSEPLEIGRPKSRR
jgi:formylglycine-generating enzyme required for sulfatase activity